MTAPKDVDALEKARNFGPVSELRINCLDLFCGPTVLDNGPFKLVINMVFKRLVEDLGFRNCPVRVLLCLPIGVMTDWALESASFLV